MNVTFIIDGIIIDEADIDGGADGSITIQNPSVSPDGDEFSASLTLSNDAYKRIFEKIICAPNPRLASVTCKILDDCCKNDDGSKFCLFEGVITGKDLKWCDGECSLEAKVSDASQKSEFIRCLKNRLIWDEANDDDSITSDGEDEARKAPYLTYCMELRPKVLHEILMILGIIVITLLRPLFFVVGLIVTVINVLISAVNTLPFVNIPLIDFDGNDDTNAFEELNGWIGDLRDLIVACGRKHKTPFVFSYLSNICKLCGLELSSSVFGVGEYYHDTVRLDAAQFENGQRNTGKIERAYEANKPNLNGIQFLNSWKEFNLDWRIEGNVLHLDHRTENASTEWFDLNSLSKDEVISFCFSFDGDPPCAYASYEYRIDNQDETGDEVNHEWTDDVIDWNTPPLPELSGLCKTELNYGTAQFRKDKFRPDIAAIDKRIYSGSLAYPNLNQYQNVLLMSKGRNALPKLLIYDTTSPLKDARVEHKAAGNLFCYNWRWHIKENFTDPTAYQELFFDDDPRVQGIKNISYVLKVSYTCEMLRNMSVNKYLTANFKGVSKRASVEKIQISYNDRTMTISGKI